MYIQVDTTCILTMADADDDKPAGDIFEDARVVGYLEGLRMPVTSLRIWILSWLRLKPSMVVSSCR
jgi:hypothetical protein